ncbi:unnamed protein product [Dibothriocephalus latus]|uniref:Uncharacterized protein n=1 Tax=Dibothriocephalus latus TaxID=60516 RepID=A0A3P7LNT8_DIBLA|nr:unnamed protein product [Dibothriocephalus latus]
MHLNAPVLCSYATVFVTDRVVAVEVQDLHSANTVFVVTERDQVLKFKERLNTVFLDIQFTMEEEENNQLAFLDILVCRKNGGCPL